MVAALVETGYRAQKLTQPMLADATRALRRGDPRPASLITGLARLVATQPEPPR